MNPYAAFAVTGIIFLMIAWSEFAQWWGI